MYVNFTTKLEQFSISDTLSTSSLTIIFYKGFLQHYYRIIEKNTDGKGFQRPSCTVSYSKYSPLWLGFLGWCPPEFRYCQKQRTHNLSRHLPHLFDNQYNEKSSLYLIIISHVPACNYCISFFSFARPWEAWLHLEYIVTVLCQFSVVIVEAPSMNKNFICDLTKVELGTRFTSLELLVVLLLIHPSMWIAFIAAKVHYWLLFNWLSIWISSPTYCKTVFLPSGTKTEVLYRFIPSQKSLFT